VNNGSCVVWRSVLFSFRVLAIMSLVSLTGMLAYRFEISSEARANWASNGVSCSLWIRSLVLLRVYVLGRGL
jgi:hypothetical protein